ncbi:MAG: winged helix-turn-helix transcriptional regulator [Alphaproteobacteria bacterium]|nr:winged helix-turn-helix transcriptional regulator [Alphaproteobacteria bacterium]
MSITDNQIDAVALLLGALGEASRLRIVRALWDGPAAVGQIVAETGLKQANVSKQLGLLVDAGILARRREGVSIIYAIALPMVRELCSLVCEGARQVAMRRLEALAPPAPPAPAARRRRRAAKSSYLNKR